MATWDDVRRLASSLPEMTERISRDTVQWQIRNKLVAWERPLRRADIEALGASAPDGDVLGVRVPDLGAKQAWLASDPAVFFTTPHFDGHPSVLVQLDRIGVDDLEELMTDAWLDRAPKRLAAQYLSQRD